MRSGAGSVFPLPCVGPLTIGTVPFVASGAFFPLALLAMAPLFPLAGFTPLVLVTLTRLSAIAIFPLPPVALGSLVRFAPAQLLMAVVGLAALDLMAFAVGEALTLVPLSVVPFGVVLGIRLLAGHGGSASR